MKLSRIAAAAAVKPVDTAPSASGEPARTTLSSMSAASTATAASTTPMPMLFTVKPSTDGASSSSGSFCRKKFVT